MSEERNEVTEVGNERNTWSSTLTLGGVGTSKANAGPGLGDL